MDDVLLNKAQTIEKCISRIREIYIQNKDGFEKNFDAQDIIVLNLQRACEACIDSASHIVRKEKLGTPQSSRDFFELLASHEYISDSLKEKMQNMVGFRNIAVHDYQDLNLKVLESILEKNLTDFLEFTKAILQS